MHKNFWKELANKWPISILAPMDGYTDSPYRQIVKEIAPQTVVFSEFYSADGLVHSKDLQEKALKHHNSEYPLIIQIFWKDPKMFAEAAKIIEWYGITGIDINMGCPAKKVVKSGHGSSLMINRETAFEIVEAMTKAVKIPISVKTRLGWDNHELLIDFVKGLENAGANLISVHGRTYKQAFNGKADFTGIYELKQHVDIPVICNWDIINFDDWMQKIIHPDNRNGNTSEKKNLDGFMIGRASFGNPWCFLPWNHNPTLWEILEIMEKHGNLLWEWKWRKWMMEARKHLVQYLHSFPNAKEYRSQLVQVENPNDIINILSEIKKQHSMLLSEKLWGFNTDAFSQAWE